MIFKYMLNIQNIKKNSIENNYVTSNNGNFKKHGN